MGWGGPGFILAIIAMSMGGWVITSWIRAKHGYPLEGEWGGTVTKQEYWGVRSLTFKIKKNRKGHYVLFNIDAPWAAVAELERQIKLNEDIIRHLTIRVEALEEAPSSGMLAKQARERRDAKWGRREDGEGGGYEAEGAAP